MPASHRLLLAAAFLALTLSTSAAQQAVDGTYYSRQPNFRIPFQVDANERRVREVQLYVSEDQGRTWQQVAKAQPGERYFPFQARREGWYWFTVRTIDVDDRAYPQNVEQAPPRLKVCVDTQVPGVVLRSSSAAGATCGVEWEVKDENLDPESLRLDYRLPGGEWLPLSLLTKSATGQRVWNPATNATLEVRFQARDFAGNPGEALISVVPGQARTASTPTAETGSGVRMVNNKRISINYELKDVGKSGVAHIELWYTRDGRSWQKYDERAQPQPPYAVEVSDEGLYGFSLVARNRAGLGEQPPRVGDPPQVWVEVDLTKPLVRLSDVQVGRGTDAGNLVITYSAADRNLATMPISISYAERLDGPWTPVARAEGNNGRYVWRMGDDVPYQFFVRVEATDRAGNVGAAETAKPIIVDLSQPKVNVLGVEPAVK